jgi:integrase
VANIKKRGKKFLVRWRDPDGKQRGASFNKLEKAKEHVKDVEDCTTRGIRWEPRDARPIPDLRQTMIAYVTHLSTTKSPRTLMNISSALDLFAEFLGLERRGQGIDVLSLPRLEGFYNWLRKATTGRHGAQRSLDTCKKYLEIVQTFWKWCSERDEYMEHTPPPRRIANMPRDPGKHVDAPSWDEMDACIALAGTAPPAEKQGTQQLGDRACYPIALGVMRALGLRVFQAMHFRVRDIDIERGRYVFPGELGKTAQERRGRVCPIAPSMLPFLAELVRDREPDEWLCPLNREGVKARELRTEFVSSAWARAGVRDSVWSGRPDHCFRKGFVTGLKAAGAEREAIEVLVGHSLGLAGIYTAANAHKLDAAVALIPAFSEDARAALWSAMSTTAKRKTQ